MPVATTTSGGDERLKAGLLHLHLVVAGNERRGGVIARDEVVDDDFVARGLIGDGDRRLGNGATRLVGHKPSDDASVLTLPEQQTCKGEKGNSCQDDPTQSRNANSFPASLALPCLKTLLDCS